MNRPRIAVPEIGQNVMNYKGALQAAGLDPVVISVQDEQLQNGVQQEYLDVREFRVQAYDGLLLPGGWDINPARYGQEDKGCLGVSDVLDDLQLSMLDAFVKAKKPVLGICRGHQLVNVYFGGTLIQHLPTYRMHARGADEQDRAHRSEAAAGSWLAELYSTSFMHNSSHHQAVDRLGEGLVIDAWCPDDGTVEAMHHEHLPVYCVQWHPERMCLKHERPDTENGLPVFRFFARLCAAKSQLPAESLCHLSDGLGL